MELPRKTSTLLQLAVIASTSMAAAYAFQNTETTFQINGLCIYRYLAYAATVVLGYVSFSQYRKYVGLAFSISLSTIAFSPIGQKAIELLPLVVPIIAVLMGVTTVLALPHTRGKGFFELLALLVLPAILAESRIGGLPRFLATSQPIGYLTLSAITVTIIGGFFYLKYAAASNLSVRELLSGGANQKDVVDAGNRKNIMLLFIVFVASAITVFSLVAGPIAANALEATASAHPLYVVALALTAGTSIPAIIYILQYPRGHR